MSCRCRIHKPCPNVGKPPVRGHVSARVSMAPRARLKDLAMSVKTPHRSFSWPRFGKDPSWVPLYRAPFVYRIRSGEGWAEAWDSVTLGSQLASRLQHLGVRDAIIDSSSGEVTLMLS